MTLTVIGWKGGSAEPANMKQINAAFEKAYPNIKVDYTFADSGTYPTKLNAEFLGGQAQDVVMANSTDVPRWAKSGYLADLSSQPWVAQLASPVKPLATWAGRWSPNRTSSTGSACSAT